MSARATIDDELVAEIAAGTTLSYPVDQEQAAEALGRSAGPLVCLGVRRIGFPQLRYR
jgi:hypothetical protein